jgi:hypothetical protein
MSPNSYRIPLKCLTTQAPSKTISSPIKREPKQTRFPNYRAAQNSPLMNYSSVNEAVDNIARMPPNACVEKATEKTSIHLNRRINWTDGAKTTPKVSPNGSPETSIKKPGRHRFEPYLHSSRSPASGSIRSLRAPPGNSPRPGPRLQSLSIQVYNPKQLFPDF